MSFTEKQKKETLDMMASHVRKFGNGDSLRINNLEQFEKTVSSIKSSFLRIQFLSVVPKEILKGKKMELDAPLQLSIDYNQIKRDAEKECRDIAKANMNTTHLIKERFKTTISNCNEVANFYNEMDATYLEKCIAGVAFSIWEVITAYTRLEKNLEPKEEPKAKEPQGYPKEIFTPEGFKIFKEYQKGIDRSKESAEYGFLFDELRKDKFIYDTVSRTYFHDWIEKEYNPTTIGEKLSSQYSKKMYFSKYELIKLKNK